MGACFFDLDGTLADTRADLAATVNDTRRDLGLAVLSEADVIRHVGQGARHLLMAAIPEAADDFEAVRARFMAHYAEECCVRVRPYPTVERTLEALVGRGWKLGVVTNKPSVPTRLILSHLGFDRFFGEAVVAGGDCPELKPSALPLRTCAERLGGHVLSAADWMIGDSWTDLHCASAAGVRAAFCTYGFGTLRDGVYDLRVDRMADFLSGPNRNPSGAVVSP